MMSKFFICLCTQRSWAKILFFCTAILLTSCAAPPSQQVEIEITPPGQKPKILPSTELIVEPEQPNKPVLVTPEVPERTHTQVAVLLPLSGNAIDIGKSLLRGAELALYQYADENFMLKLYDTQGRRLKALQAARSAITDGADVVIGPLFSHTTSAVVPLFGEAGIPVLSFSNSEKLLDEAANEELGTSDLHLLGITPSEELRNLLEVGILLDLKRFALIAPDDSYGAQIYRNMIQFLNQDGITFVDVAFYDPSSIDFSPVVQQISDFRQRRQAYKDEVQKLIDEGITNKKIIQAKMNFRETYGELPFDSIVLVTYDDNSLRTLAAQLEFYEVEPERVQYMGLSQWQNYPDLSLEPSLRGSWYVGLDSEAMAEFNALYENAYGKKAGSFAALGYDALAMLTHASTEKDIQGDLLQKLLQLRSGIGGATGVFRLENNGKVSRHMAVFEITKTGTKLLMQSKNKWLQ